MHALPVSPLGLISALDLRSSRSSEGPPNEPRKYSVGRTEAIRGLIKKCSARSALRPPEAFATIPRRKRNGPPAGGLTAPIAAFDLLLLTADTQLFATGPLSGFEGTRSRVFEGAPASPERSALCFSTASQQERATGCRSGPGGPRVSAGSGSPVPEKLSTDFPPAALSYQPDFPSG